MNLYMQKQDLPFHSNFFFIKTKKGNGRESEKQMVKLVCHKLFKIKI